LKFPSLRLAVTFPFVSFSFPSRGQFKLLKYGVIIGLLAPLLAVSLIIFSTQGVSDYIHTIKATNLLANEGTLVT
jgi:hypothetical protein